MGKLRHLGQWLKDPGNLKWVALPVAVLGLLYVAGRLIPLATYIGAVSEWVNGLGPWAMVVFGLIFVAATLLMLPGTPFTVVAALLFGTVEAFYLMVAATTASSVIAFLVARHLAREQIRSRLMQSELMERFLRAVDDNNWYIIPSIRIAPVFPYAFNNYALGLTKISFIRYLLLSELVLVPMNGVLVVSAQFLYRAIIKGEVSWALFGITTAGGALVLGFGYLAKRLVEASRAGGQPAGG